LSIHEDSGQQTQDKEEQVVDGENQQMDHNKAYGNDKC